MDHFLRRLILFFLCGIVGYCTILILWSNLIPFDALKKNLNYKMGSYGHLHTRINELDTLSDIDILVLGSSHVDPRIFQKEGLTMFNLGSSNQTPKQALGLLELYLMKTKPELVVYEVYPGIFQQDGLEATLDLVANGPMKLDVVEMALKSGNVKAYNALINRFFIQSLGKYHNFNEPLRKPKDYDTYISGGYVQKDDDYLRDQSLNGQYAWYFRDDQWEDFLEIRSILNEENIDFLMVQSPIDSAYFQNGTNNSEVDSRFDEVGNYINFNRILTLHYKEDLYDLHHLKQSGVEKFNMKLIQLIREKGYLD